jgi:hypothetical protein
VSDERKKAKSKKASDERHAEVADRLGFKPEEIAVFKNPDGEYAVVKDGHRLLLQDEGRVAWYGDEAPNPTYPLVRPSVLIDETDVEAIEGPLDLPLEPGEEPLPKDDAGANIALTQPVEGKGDLDDGGVDAVVDNKAAAIAADKQVEDLAEAKAAEKKPGPAHRPGAAKK